MTDVTASLTDTKSSQPLRVVFAGTPEFAAQSLQALIEQQSALNIEIIAVYTQPDRKAGRGQKLTPSAVKAVALEHNIAVEQPLTFKKSAENGQQARATLRKYAPDIMVVAAYGLILPLEVLNTPRYGCLNIHASLLPRWRGAAPIHRALLAGDSETGITIMQMDKGLDTGDMLYKTYCPIATDDTAQSLHDKLAEQGADAITTVLADLPSYQNQAAAQDDSQANYADKLVKTEGEIDWTQPAAVIERQIRGLTPWPGTYTFLDGARVKILATLPVNDSQVTDLPAGTVISVGRKAILVACGADEASSAASHDDESSNKINTTLAITQMQFAGSKPMSAEQLCHGNKLDDGDVFAMSAP